MYSGNFFIGDPALALPVVDYLNLVESGSGSVVCDGLVIQCCRCYMPLARPMEIYDRDCIPYLLKSGYLALIPWKLCKQLHRKKPDELPGRCINFQMTPPTLRFKSGVVTVSNGLDAVQINTLFKEEIYHDLDREQLLDKVRDLYTHISRLEEMLAWANVPFESYNL